MISVLLFFLTYVSGFILSFRVYPIFAFVLYEAVYFFNPESRWWGKIIPDISYSFYISVLLIIFLVTNFEKTKENRLLAIPQFRWAYLILFLYCVAYTYAAIPILHYNAMVNMIKLFIVISIAYKLCDTDKKFDYVLWGYILGAWYISFYAWQVGRNSGGRVERIGTVDAPDSNGLAAAIAPSLVLCLYYFWTVHNKYAKVAFAFAGIFIANAIVLINSRGAFLGVAISIMIFMYYMYFSSFQRQYQKLSAVFITIAGLSGALYLADDAFMERIYSIADETEVNEEQESGATRMIFWAASVEMAKDYPFGNGFRGFNVYAHLYIPDDVHTGRKKNRTVHSTWFEALSEIGYLGFFSLIMMLFYCAKTTQSCKKQLKKDKQVDQYFKVIAIQAALIAFMIAMTFMNRLRAEILYWCVMYTGIAYNIYILKKQAPEKAIDVSPIKRKLNATN
jgi:hypothetical protein